MDSKAAGKRIMATSSNMDSKKFKTDSSNMIIPNANEFRETAMPQTFSFPKPTIEYLLFSSPKVYQKLVKCCKHLYLQYPVTVLNNLGYEDEMGWECCKENECGGADLCEHDHEKCVMEKYQNKKIWVSNSFSVHGDSQDADYVVSKPDLVSFFIPKIWGYDVTVLQLTDQKLLYNELQFLRTGVKDFCFNNNVIKYGNGAVVPVEDIIMLFAGAEKIRMNFSHTSDNASCKSYKDLADACNTVAEIEFYCIPEFFNVTQLYQHLKCSKNRALIKILSRHDDDNLLRVIDEILSTTSFECVPPVVECDDVHESIIEKMEKIQATEAAKHR